jgi:Bacterial Ig domain
MKSSKNSNMKLKMKLKTRIAFSLLFFLKLTLFNGQNWAFDRDGKRVKVGDYLEIVLEYSSYEIYSHEIEPQSNFSFKLGNPVAKVIDISENKSFKLEFTKQEVISSYKNPIIDFYFGPFAIWKHSNICRLLS